MKNYERILKNLPDLPPLPVSARMITKMIERPDCNFAEVTKILEKCPSLVARLLRCANRSLFYGQNKITSVKGAIAKLGFPITCKLITTAVFSEYFDTKRCPAFPIHAYWNRSLWLATASRNLARNRPELSKQEREAAYTCALLANIAVLALAHVLPERLNSAMDKNIDIEDWSQLTMATGINLQKVTIQLLDGAWRLPGIISDVATHLYSGAEGSNYPHLLALLNDLREYYKAHFTDAHHKPVYSILSNTEAYQTVSAEEQKTLDKLTAMLAYENAKKYDGVT